jgi:hydrogenase maturation protease
MKTLLIGIGNSGRQDDGLGPALVERLAGKLPPERSIVDLSAALSPLAPGGPGVPAGDEVGAYWTYQLYIEDAASVRDCARVVFADAAFESAAPAELVSLDPSAEIAVTSHEMSAASVLALAEELYGKAPAGFLLKIRGAEWDFSEDLSAEGRRNLAEAERILREWLALNP